MSLADLSTSLRSALKWFSIAVIVIVLLWLGFIILRSLSEAFLNQRTDYTVYGVLPAPLFSNTFFKLSQSNFQLESSLPNNGERAKVYKSTENKKLSAQSQDRLINFFGFSAGKKSQTNGLITWSNKDSYLKVDTLRGQFTYRLDYLKQGSVGRELFDDNQAKDKAEKILKSLDILSADIAKENSRVEFFEYIKNKLVPLQSDRGPVGEVRYYRRIGKLVSGGEPQIRLLLAKNGEKILEFDYKFSSIDASGASYPIISSSQAWGRLQSGEAFVEKDQKFANVKVKGIEFSYYESRFYQPYLQPIWIFVCQGVTNNVAVEFEAFMPAVSPSFLAQSP